MTADDQMALFGDPRDDERVERERIVAERLRELALARMYPIHLPDDLYDAERRRQEQMKTEGDKPHDR
jgi:hypothetical protein